MVWSMTPYRIIFDEVTKNQPKYHRVNYNNLL